MKSFLIKYRIMIAFLLLAGVLFGILFFERADFRQGKIHNVVLISIDTCRADYLSCYGYPHKTTPNIDAVAEEGILFENVISPNPLTLPAHSSMLTGTNPLYHGVHDNANYQLNHSNVTLAEILKEKGFATGAIISALVLHRRFGIDQGFDEYNDKFEKEYMAGHIRARKGVETTRFAVDWLDRHKDERFFLFLHYYDPHYDYAPPEPFASEFASDLYAGEIAYADHCIGQVINRLKELVLYDSTLVIITSDHGEMLGEHGEEQHSYFIYQSAIKVPLIFKLPGQLKGKQIKEVVGLIDIFPTICSLLGIEKPEKVQGIDLSGCFTEKELSGRREKGLYCESLTPTKYNANSLLGVVTNRFKYIQTRRPELYDLIKDPQEMNNLAKKDSQRARILKESLAEIVEQSVCKDRLDGEINLDDSMRKRLESLGYVSDSVTEEFSFDQTKDDPKDVLDLHLLNVKINLCIPLRQFEKAKLMAKKIIQRRPDNAIGYKKLGQIALEQKDYLQAVARYRKAVELEPDDVQAHKSLGSLLFAQGEVNKAISHLSEVVRLKPDSTIVLNNLAGLLCVYKGGKFHDPEKAVRLAERCCELTNYENAGFLATLGIAYGATGRFSDAVSTAKKALETAEAAQQKELAKWIQKHLSLYRIDESYSEPLPWNFAD